MRAALVVFAVLAVVALKVNADLSVVCSEYQEEDKIEYHPHPCDCHTYYVCMGTEPVPMPCPRGLHWSQKLERCEWPNKAHCRPQPEC
ncbi:peritrophin-1-like [Lasioglossum baleicum]|uniref:peritrophin-1-like n=1 Tax=Lasioglossum baleicum TaxID=434251 RepID=UPI003FCDCFB7